jgi:branched-chain amino acid transport system ATP-binding protein
MSLLETASMSVTFGGLNAVNEVDLTVEEGQIVGLIGPNGAGKTTFIDGLTGFVRTSGRIRFDGQDIQDLPAHQRKRHGLGRTWQSLELFDDLNIRDNLRVSSEQQSVGGFFLDLVMPNRARDSSNVDFALDVLGISHLGDRMPNEISQGQRKLVSAARALAARPQLVCMDEPAAGLDTNESKEFARDLLRIRDAGMTILMVEHDMGLVLSVCDYIYCIEFGLKIAEGTPREITQNSRVIEAYLGSEAAKHDDLEVDVSELAIAAELGDPSTDGTAPGVGD